MSLNACVRIFLYCNFDLSWDAVWRSRSTWIYPFRLVASKILRTPDLLEREHFFSATFILADSLVAFQTGLALAHFNIQFERSSAVYSQASEPSEWKGDLTRCRSQLKLRGARSDLIRKWRLRRWRNVVCSMEFFANFDHILLLTYLEWEIIVPVKHLIEDLRGGKHEKVVLRLFVKCTFCMNGLFCFFL